MRHQLGEVDQSSSQKNGTYHRGRFDSNGAGSTRDLFNKAAGSPITYITTIPGAL